MASQQQQQQRRRRHSSCDLTDLPSEAEAEENVTRTLGGGGGEPRTAGTKAAAADAETAAVDFKPQSVPPTKKLDEVVREDRSLFDFLSF